MAGHRLGALEGGEGTSPPSNASLRRGPHARTQPERINERDQQHATEGQRFSLSLAYTWQKPLLKSFTVDSGQGHPPSHTCMGSTTCATIVDAALLRPCSWGPEGTTRDEAKEGTRAGALSRGENRRGLLLASHVPLSTRATPPTGSFSRALMAEARAALPVPRLKRRTGAEPRTLCEAFRARAWAAPDRRLSGDLHRGIPCPAIPTKNCGKCPQMACESTQDTRSERRT